MAVVCYTPAMTLSIRLGEPGDVKLIHQFICQLADYEKLGHEVRATPEALAEQLFSERPAAEVLIGEIDRRPSGFALFFLNFSTFEAKPGLYLEDLFVEPHARGSGLGKALLAKLAKIALERNCARMEWSVLDWNEPALGFYRSIGARPMNEWTVQRLSGERLTALADLADSKG